LICGAFSGTLQVDGHGSTDERRLNGFAGVPEAQTTRESALNKGRFGRGSQSTLHASKRDLRARPAKITMSTPLASLRLRRKLLRGPSGPHWPGKEASDATAARKRAREIAAPNSFTKGFAILDAGTEFRPDACWAEATTPASKSKVPHVWQIRVANHRHRREPIDLCWQQSCWSKR
jgi:hypothetical protein